MIEKSIIGYIENDEQCLLGTCFFFCNNYILTARHVIKNCKYIRCIFPDLHFKTDVILEYENEEFDFAVLKYSAVYEEPISYYNVSITEAEYDDNWETKGYPVINGKDPEYVFGTIRMIINNNPCTIYELSIKDAVDSCDWSGISGAPLLIENDALAGIIVSQKESNIKSRLKAISLLGILSVLETERPYIIENIKSNYDEVLKERMNYFDENIKNIFHEFSIEAGIIENNCFVLKNSNDSLSKLADMVAESIRSYGASIVLYKKSKTGTYREKSKADLEIDKNTKKIIGLISTNSQLAYILLWILAEGARHCPRIGSRILDNMSDAMTDIYVDENDTLCIYFSVGKINEDFWGCFETELEQIDKDINNHELSLKKEIIDWDELVITSLRYNNQKIINNYTDNNIEVGIFMMTSYEHYNLYRRENKVSETNDRQNKKIMFEKYCADNLPKIEQIVAKYGWIKKIKIEHFVLPFNDMAQFKAVLEAYL